MKQVITLVVLGLLTTIGAVTEMLFQELPHQFIQINGLLTIIFAMAFVILTLRLQASGVQQSK